MLESVYFLPCLFLLVALVTRKDLAIYAAAVSWLGVFVFIQDRWPVESTLLAFAALNCSMAVFSAYHYKAFNHKLGLAVSIIATLAVTNNLIQVLTWHDWTITVSEVLAWALLVALIMLPGRRGWIDDLAMDCNSVRRSCSLRDRSGSQHRGNP